MKNHLLRNGILKGAITVALAVVLSGCNGAGNVATQDALNEVVEEVQSDLQDVDSSETVETETEEVIPEETADDIENTEDTDAVIELEDGKYYATFTTDSTMFHVNELYDDKGILTVEDGKAVIHIVLTSKNIKNLYLGVIADAENDETGWLQPTVEEVTYPDGLTDEANAFDVPVPFLDDEFDLALIGKKGIWYDHKVSVSNVEPYTEDENADDKESSEEESDAVEADVTSVNVTLEGGSGKSTVESPTGVKSDENGQLLAVIKWSSPHYDYMIVDGEKYLPVNTEGNSVFEIPIESTDSKLDVIADTVAMSKPHEIEYTLTFETAK